MRRLNVDREDDPAPGIRILDPQELSARPVLPAYVGARKGTAIAGLWEKVLAKHYAIRRPHPVWRHSPQVRTKNALSVGADIQTVAVSGLSLQRGRQHRARRRQRCSVQHSVQWAGNRPTR